MNYQLLLSKTKEKLNNEPSGHDFLHALRVLSNVDLILTNENVDIDVIKTSAIVHDLIDDKLDDTFKMSENEMDQLLHDCGLLPNQIKHVQTIIRSISYRKHQTLDSLEAKIVQDADRLDALGAIGIARTFAYGGAHNRQIVNEHNVDTGVGHFYDKLFKLKDLMNTKSGIIEAEKRTKFMHEYINELQRETNISDFRRTK